MVQPKLVASGAQTANGTSSTLLCTLNSMLVASIDATAGTSVSHFSLWLTGSHDEVTWWPAPADIIVDEAESYTQVAARTNARNVVNDMTSFAALKTNGYYKHFPYKFARLRWYGTFTSITFSGWLSSK